MRHHLLPAARRRLLGSVVLTLALAAATSAGVLARQSLAGAPADAPADATTFRPSPAGVDAPRVLGGDAVPDLIVSPGTGGQPTRILDGATLGDLGGGFPFGPGFGASVRTAAGELSGDTVADIVVAMGPGGGLVRLYNGVTIAEIASGYPFGPGFTGGVNVATGDVNGDGRADIIVSQASGGGGVMVFSGTDISLILAQAPFGPGYTGGVNVASGDVDGDGRADIIVSQAANGGVVSVISGATQAITVSGVPYGALPGGVFVAAADVNGDGRADVIAAPGTGTGPVLVYDIASLSLVASFSPYTTAPGGTRVAATDLDGDGRADIITTPGPGVAPELHVYSGATFALTASQLVYSSGYTGGVFISAVPGTALRFESAAATTFTAGTAGTFTVTVAGSPRATVITTTGPLPAGVTLTNNSNGTATLAGTPAAGTGGSYPFTITASSVSSTITQPFTLTVSEAPAITSAATTTFTQGASGTFTVTTTGSPAATLSVTGLLPAGVTFTDHGNGTGTLAGIPAPGSAASYPLTLTASNGVGSSATQAFVLEVDSAAAFTSAAATTFTVGTPGSFTVTTTGGLTPANISRTGTLPSGVTFTDNGNGTGTLAGTPAAATGGTYAITFTATNGVGSPAVQNFTLTVNQAPAITSVASAVFNIGTAESFTITTTGFPAAVVSVTGALPTGVTFTNLGNGTGTLAGTPASGSGGTYPLTIGAANGVGMPASQPFTLTVGLVPTAQDETFSNGVGNTQYSVGAGTPSTPAVVVSGSVLTNDTGVAPLSAGPPVIATTNGGQVTMAGNGSFLYTPAVGFAGPADTFTYTLTDGNNDTDTAVVTINLSGVVWYVNPLAAGTDGRSHSPFATMTAAAAAAQPGQVIYVHQGAPGGTTVMKAGQTLWGAGAVFVLNGLTIPATAAPVLQGTVTLANDVAVGAISVTGGGAAAIAGSSLTGTETLTAVSITGGATGLTLTNLTGTLTMTGGSITGVTAGAAVAISGGTGTIAVGASITNTGGRSIDIQNRTAGTVTFSGAIADSGSGIHLENNPGAAITFTGGMSVTTNTADAFTAIGGGIVSATQNNLTVVNTLASTSGHGLRMINTQMGAIGMTFRRIASGNSGYGPGVGIVLDNTGIDGASGSLTVVGNGTPGSGGVIRRKSGADGSITSGLGMYLHNTKGPSFRWMQLSDFDNGAILGMGVVDFALQDSVIEGTVGTVAGEGGLMFGRANPSGENGLLGTGLLRNVQVSGSAGHNAAFHAQSGTLTLQIDGTTRPSCGLSGNSSTTGGDGLFVLTQGTAAATVTIDRCQFRSNRAAGIRGLAEDTSSLTVNIDEADIVRLPSNQGEEGAVLRNSDDATLTTTITQSYFDNLPGANVWLGQEPFNASAASLLRATISNNEAFTQTAGASAPPWVVALSSTIGQVARSRVLISDNINVLSPVLESLRISTPDAGTSPAGDITLLDNHTDTEDSVNGPYSATIAATQAGANLCTRITGNTFHWLPGPAGGPLRVSQANGATFRLERGVSAISDTPSAVLTANNNVLTLNEVVGTLTVVDNATCLLPSAP